MALLKPHYLSEMAEAAGIERGRKGIMEQGERVGPWAEEDTSSPKVCMSMPSN